VKYILPPLYNTNSNGIIVCSPIVDTIH
jgi:hypothetical protein